MIFARLLIATVFLILAVLILNVIVPFMFPKFQYWWMFRRTKIEMAEDQLDEVKDDIKADKILDKTEELIDKHQKSKQAKATEND